MEIKVEESDLLTALEILGQIPEFDLLKETSHYQECLADKKNLILVAKADDKIIGCKVGYDRYADGSFYSWLGGVLPQYRKLGIAKLLADYQEKWARKQGFKSIRFKTQNRHKSMLHFALGNGFSIFNVKPKEELDRYRIELIKQL